MCTKCCSCELRVFPERHLHATLIVNNRHLFAFMQTNSVCQRQSDTQHSVNYNLEVCRLRLAPLHQCESICVAPIVLITDNMWEPAASL